MKEATGRGGGGGGGTPLGSSLLSVSFMNLVNGKARNSMSRAFVGEERGIPMFTDRKYSVLEEAEGRAEGRLGLFLFLLQRDTLLPGG